MRAGWFVVLCWVAVGGSSCKAKAKPTIVGKWQTESGSTIEFRADGTATSTSTTGTREMKYRFVTDRQIEVSTVQGVIAGHWIIESLTADQVTASLQESGTRSTFRRIQ
jgi:hypothetical protein